MTQAVLGIDIGTGSTRCLVTDGEGAILASGDAPYDLIHRHPGWAEQEPQTWWDATVTAVRSAMASLAVEVELVGIGIAGQQAGLVILDRDGEASEPGVLWCDNRSDAQGRSITEASGATATTYGGPVTGAQWAAKLAWRRDHGMEAPVRVMGVKDYVRSRLVDGPHVTDPVEASVSGLFDVGRGVWMPERLAEVDLDESALPVPRPADEQAGTLTPAAAAELGLPAGLPVTVGIGDCGAAGLGVGAVTPGDEYLGFGSSGITFRVQGEFDPDPGLRVRTCQFVPSGEWFTMGVVQTLGLSWSWWRGVLNKVAGAPLDHDDLVALASKSRPGANGLVFLPYLMGDQTPHMDGRLRGSFVGLDIAHGTEDMTRAVLESMAFAMWDGYKVLPGTPASGELVLTGKAVGNQLWLTMLAALFARPLTTVAVHEGSAYGAAVLAWALASGRPLEQVSRAWASRSGTLAAPDAGLTEQMTEAYRRYVMAFPAAGAVPPLAS